MEENEQPEPLKYKPELAFCTVDELWDELKRRFNASVLITEGPGRSMHHAPDIAIAWRGSLPHISGLLHYAGGKLDQGMFASQGY